MELSARRPLSDDTAAEFLGNASTERPTAGELEVRAAAVNEAIERNPAREEMEAIAGDGTGDRGSAGSGPFWGS